MGDFGADLAGAALGLAIPLFGHHPVTGRLRKSAVQGRQIHRLKAGRGPGIAAHLAFRRHGQLNDALRALVLYKGVFRLLELFTGLLKAVLQKLAGIVVLSKPADQVVLEKGVGDVIGGLGRQAAVGAVVADPDQARRPDRVDLQAGHDQVDGNVDSLGAGELHDAVICPAREKASDRGSAR